MKIDLFDNSFEWIDIDYFDVCYGISALTLIFEIDSQALS